jgi:prepilin-type N-terminal cleavage/methylation domain-containing protein
MKRIKGFTLIELLVVLAIIAFLAAVLLGLAIPNYVKLIVVTALVVITISASFLIIKTIFKATLFKACRKGDIEAVKQHLAAGADVNATNDALLRIWELKLTPLHFAAENGHKKVVELLIAKGADVNVKVEDEIETPLHSAASRGHKEIVELLIAEGADVNAKDCADGTPLDAAQKKGIADLLRKYGGKTGYEDYYEELEHDDGGKTGEELKAAAD